MNQQYAQEYRRKADENDGVPVMVWIDEPPDHGAKDLWQAKVGIGFEEQLNPNTTLNIEVDYIDDSNSLFFYSTGTNNFTVNTKQVKYMLGLSYYF